MINVLVGPNRFTLQRSLQKAKRDFITKHGELAVESIEADELEPEEITSVIKSTSLFNPERMVVVKSLSGNKQAAEIIDDIIDSTPDSTHVFVVEPEPDKRSSYFKKLKKRTGLKEFPQIDERGAAKWLVDEAQSEGCELSFADANYLVSKVGVDQGKLHTELRKLIDYGQGVDRGTIDLLAEPNPENSIFELLEAVFNGKKTETLKIYGDLRRSGSQPAMILAMLVWQIHQVALVACAKGRSIDRIASDSGISSFPLQKSARIAHKLTLNQIKSLAQNLQALDRKLKTQTIDSDEALKNMLLRIATRK